MNYDRIRKDFQNMTADTEKLINKYNQTCDSIKNQEIAIEKVKDKLAKLQAYSEHGLLKEGEDAKIEELKAKLEILNNKLGDSKEKAADLGKSINESLNNNSTIFFGKKIDDVGKKIDKVKNRISRLIGTVAIYNLMRSSLTSLRNNFITLLKINDQFSSSLSQIRANLMIAFAPIYNACLPAINRLMDTLSKVTGTIAVFVSNLFGTGLQDATKDAKKLSKALNKTSSSAKKVSGSLASFDTLETIPEASNASSGKSNNTIDYSGELTYSQKLLDIMNKVKDIIVDIWTWGSKNKELVIELGVIIGTAFALSKVVNFIVSLKPLTKLLTKISGLFVKVDKDGTKSFNKVGTGATIAVAGFALLLKNIVDLITNWDELSTKQKLIKAGMAVLGAAAIALGVAIALGISTATLGIGALIALITTAVTAVLTFVAKLVTEKDAILSTKDAQEQLNQAKQDYINANENYVNAIDRADEALKGLQDAEKQTGLSGEELYQSVQNGTLDYSKMTDAQKKVYKAYLENKKAQDSLTEATETLSAAKKAETDASFANQLAIAAESGNYDDYKKSVIEAYENGTLSAEEARDKLEQAMSRMSKSTQKTFMEDIPSDISNGMDPSKYQTTWQKFKYGFLDVCNSVGNFFSKLFSETIPNKLEKLGNSLKKFFTKTVPNIVLSAIESVINSIITMFEGMMNKPIKAINKLINTANKIPGVEISKFSEVNLGRISMPRLAKGTVIPPRQEFAAILGDQKHGTNIEAPLETIKQANREVLEEILGRAGVGSQTKEIILKNWQFILQFGGTEFGKLIIDEIKKYEDETGTQFLLA